MSWDEAFADRYAEWSAHMTADVAFYVTSRVRRTGRWSSSRSGTGGWRSRSRRPTASAVIGIDTSPAMLAQARARAAEAGVELDLREGDMRDLALD